MMAKKKLPQIIRMSYKYRAYCNKATQSLAILWMADMANVWNEALKERQETFAVSKENPDIKPVSHKFGQYHHIKRSEHPELAHVNIIALQAVLAKLHDSYKSFFSLIKKDDKARPPREKRIHRIIELGRVNDEPFGWSLNGKNLIVKGLGRFKLRLHRPIEGKIKTVTITLQNQKWYVCFSCEVPQPHIVKKKKRTVRLHFEDSVFIKDSMGYVVHHPEFYFSAIQKIRRLSRSLSRKKFFCAACQKPTTSTRYPCTCGQKSFRPGKNRQKARYTLANYHDHIKNKRKYFIESVVNYYVENYDRIEIPKVPLKTKIIHATNSRKAMALCDAAYGLFNQKLKHSAQKVGAEIIEYVL